MERACAECNKALLLYRNVHEKIILTVGVLLMFIQLRKEREEKEKQAAEKVAAALPKKRKEEEPKMKVYKTSGIGKYINPATR